MQDFWKKLRCKIVKIYIKLLGVKFFRINEPSENKMVETIEIVAINNKKAKFTIYEYYMKDTHYSYRGFKEEVTECYLIKLEVDQELSDDLYLFNNMKLVIRGRCPITSLNRDIISPIMVEIFIEYIIDHFNRKHIPIKVETKRNERND